MNKSKNTTFNVTSVFPDTGSLEQDSNLIKDIRQIMISESISQMKKREASSHVRKFIVKGIKHSLPKHKMNRFKICILYNRANGFADTVKTETT